MSLPLNLHGFEQLAQTALDPKTLAFYAGGAADEITLGENAQAFLRRRLRPRILVDVSALDTGTALLGLHVSMPAGVAPTAQHGLVHPDGECATARAAAAANALFCASTMSSRTLEEIAAAGGPRWFQLYVFKDRGVTEDLVRRAEAAGYAALVLTVDAPVLALRDRELRAEVTLTLDDYANLRGGREPVTLSNLVPGWFDPALSWRDVAWLRALTRLPVVVKGVMTGEDASLAVEHGVAGVWVSNHGGRQLDRTPATIDVLEEIVAAVAGRAEVYVDGGVRRGIDVVIALALGAKAVFLGRPFLYALASHGGDGVAHALALLQAEIANAMALLGATSVDALRREHVL